MIVLLVPLFLARPANLTSDESLYLAEAYNIAHGESLTYPSGEAITHRAPLYPLVLAPAVAYSTELAYVVSALIIAINALWVAASFGLLLSGLVAPTPLGYAFVIAQALAVALLAELQFIGLRRTTANA